MKPGTGVGILVALSIIGLAIGQHKLIYFPRPYEDALLQLPGLVQLSYLSKEGKQTVFYLPPREEGQGMPSKIWVVFGGNASLGLDWYDFVKRYPDPKAGFVLFDYPGYGKCEGMASPKTIRASIDKALPALAKHLNSSLPDITNRLNLLGHSLGAAVALQTATRYKVDRIVLIAPFTTMRAMAAKVVGVPLNMLLIQNFDNRARLAELAAEPQPPEITLIHGDADEVVPVSMGRELAAMYPSMITYHEIAKGDHNGIMSLAEKVIYQAMNGIVSQDKAAAQPGG